MKRFLAAALSLSLVVLAPSPFAWAAFVEIARPAGSVADTGGRTGVMRINSLPQTTGMPTPATSFNAPVVSALPSEIPAAESGAQALPAATALVREGGSFLNRLAQFGRAVTGSKSPAADLNALYTNAAQGGEISSVSGAVSAGTTAGSLQPSSGRGGSDGPGGMVPAPPAAPRGSKAFGVIAVLARFAVGVAGTYGVHIGSLMLSPSVFAVVPLAAVWAVSAGVVFFPVALYARYQLSLSDSSRLTNVKRLADIVLGAYAGAVALAAPSLGLALSASSALTTAAVPALAVAGMAARGQPLFDSVATGTAMFAAPYFVAVAAAAASSIGAASIVAMMALPALTTIAMFLRSIKNAAEQGTGFSVGRLRFPTFPWVMTGVVFSLLSGFPAVYSNAAFVVWQILGTRKPSPWDKSKPIGKNLLNKLADFNVLYLGLLAYVAATGLASPLVFLVLAFASERAAMWTEGVLGRVLKPGKPAPSTRRQSDDPFFGDGTQWPKFHYWRNVILLQGALLLTGVLMGLWVFPLAGIGGSVVAAVVLSFLPFFFSRQLIKAVMKTTPADEKTDPEFFAAMRELRERINVQRRARGRKEIPMPEMVIDPSQGPNAYATGPSPMKALVGVTQGIKEMTLDPENVRDGVTRLLASSDAESDAFRVYRLAISGSLEGVSLTATPAEVQAAVLRADKARLKALGARMLRGVLAHEFSHVMDRHMLVGAVAGSVASTIIFASTKILWQVSRVEKAVHAAWDGVKNRVFNQAPPERAGAPAFVGPVTAGGVLLILKLAAALWGRELVQLNQLAISRNNEGMADEDGALLSEDPQALALALGLLITWRPKNFVLKPENVPGLAAFGYKMTVNPFQQAVEIGAMPEEGIFSATDASRGDDFLFNLFMTHPDTLKRIGRLYRMSQSKREAEAPKPPRPAGEGGGGPPLALAPSGADTAPASSGGGLFRGAWRSVKSFWRVLPDEGRNRSFWLFVAGQAVAAFGSALSFAALPALLAPTKADTERLGFNRAAGWGTQAAASFSTGSLVDHRPRTVLVGAYIGGGILGLSVPLLFLTGHWGWAAVTFVTSASAFIKSMGMTANAVVYNGILGRDEAFYNRANVISGFVANIAGASGAFALSAVAAAASSFSLVPLAGQAVSFGVGAVLLLATGVFFGWTLKTPNAASAVGARRLPLGELGKGMRLILADRFLRFYLLFSTFAAASGDWLIVTLPRYAADVLHSGSVGFLMAVASLGAGASMFAVSSGDPAQTTLTSVAAEFRTFLAEREPSLSAEQLDAAKNSIKEALPAVLSRYQDAWRRAEGATRSAPDLARDVLEEAAARLAAALRRTPSQARALMEETGVQERVRARVTARYARLIQSARSDISTGLDFLERQGRRWLLLRILGWLAGAAAFTTASLPVFAGLLAVSSFLAAPVLVVFSSLTTRVVQRRYPDDQGKIYSAINIYWLVCLIAGVVAASAVLSHGEIHAAFHIIAGFFVLCMAADLALVLTVFPRRPRSPAALGPMPKG